MALHQLRLLCELFGLDHVAHHQRSRCMSMPRLRAASMCCFETSRLGAVRGDAHRARAPRHMPAWVMHGADAG